MILQKPELTWNDSSVALEELRELGRNKLEKVYPTLNPEWTPEDREEADACWPAARKADRTETFTFTAKDWKAKFALWTESP
jgi:phosphoribosylformylglycinamidine synthase